MKLLLDQNIYAATARYLSGSGHDVVTAAEIGYSRASDFALLAEARDQHRVLLTRDRDFGGLVFVQDVGAGVIYLRVSLSTLETVHKELTRVFEQYSEEALSRAFVVIEPGRHRFRKLPR